MTTVYLIRHSKPLKVNNDLNNEELQIQNEKSCLSIDGEEIAFRKLCKTEFDNIDVLFSSNYVRAIQTAKYLAEKNAIDINVNSSLGERKYGISSWSELPDNFERKQFLDKDYKIGNGESQKEVTDRMYSAVMNIVASNKDKRIAIVSHATAISYLLKKWGDIKIVNDKLRYSFNDKVLLVGNLNYCETFKLEFDDNNIVNITNIN